MKKLLGILFVLFLLVLTASPQAVLRGRLTTNEAAWQESPLLPGLTATNLTVASNLTVRGSALNPLLPGTNVTFTTNAGVVSVHAQGGLKATNANQFGTGEVLTVKSGALLTNLTVYGDGTNALVLSSGVLTSSAPAIDISQTWSNSGVTFAGFKLNVTNSASSNQSALVDFSVDGNKNVLIIGGAIKVGGTSPGFEGYSSSANSGNRAFYLSTAAGYGQFRLNSLGGIGWSATGDATSGGTDTLIFRDSAATLQLGTDAATTTAQTLKAHDGSGTDKSGADFRLAAGQGTGTGAGGALNLATAAAGGASTNTLNAYSNRVSISPNGAVTINPTTTNATLLTLNSGVLTSSAPAIDISQTWSNSGVTFTGLKLNAIDTSSSSASLLADFQTNGTSQFFLDKRGLHYFGRQLRNGGAGYEVYHTDATARSYNVGSRSIVLSQDSNLGLAMSSAFGVHWSSSASGSGDAYQNRDLSILRDSAATLQLGADAATATAQTIKAHDGSGTDKSGADLRLAAGQGTGTGAGGTLNLATAAAGSASTNTLNSYSNRLTIDANGTVTINPTSTNAPELVINSGVITSSAPAIDISQTWSNSATTFTGLKLNVTDSSSSATSSLLDVQLGGSNRFRVDKWGSAIFLNTNGIRSDGPNYAHLKLGNGFNVGSGFMFSGYNAPHSPFLNMYMEGSGEWTARLMAGASFSWTDNPSIATSGTRDLILQRDSAAALQLGADAATPLAQTLKSHDGSGTDKNGADLTVAAGRGTGTGVGGSFAIATSAQGNVSTNTLNTASNRLVIDANGAVRINPTSTNSPELTIDSGVITSSVPALVLSQTWSNTVAGFNPLSLNIVNPTVSSNTSTLLRMTVDGTNVFYIDRLGKVNMPSTGYIGGKPTPQRFVTCCDAVDGSYGNIVTVEGSSTLYLRGGMGIAGYLGVVATDNGFLGITSQSIGNNPIGNADVRLYRDAAATLQLGGDSSTPTAQTLKSHDGSGTDKNGADLTVAAGRGTGTGVGGSFAIATSAQGSASTNTLNTASNRLVIDANGAVTINPTTTNATLLTLNSGVITSSAPALSISQTWSNSGVTFTGLRVSVADSNSASASLLADLQTGGSTRFSVDKSGKINVPTASDLTHVFCADANTASLRAGAFQFLNGSTVKVLIGQGKFIVDSTTPITWGSSGVSSTDLNLVRDAAATLQLGGDAATVTDQTLKAHDGSGTDKDGATLAIAGGQGTGAAKGGSVVLRTAPAGGSGSSKNSYGDRNFVYSGRTTLGVNAAYDLFEVNLPDGEMVGLEVFVTTFSVGGSSSDRIVNTDNFNVSAYSYGTAAYSSVSSNNISTTKSSGFDTVTTSFDVLDLNQNAFRVRVTPTFGTSTSGVTVTAVWQVRVNSTVPTTVTPF